MLGIKWLFLLIFAFIFSAKVYNSSNISENGTIKLSSYLTKHKETWSTWTSLIGSILSIQEPSETDDNYQESDWE